MTPDSKPTSTFSRINPLFVYLKKQRENQKFAKFIEIGATFFLISFFIFFAIKPTLLTISSLVGDIKAKKILKVQLKDKINDVIIAQDLYSQVQEKYLLVESSLPVNPRFYQATSQVLGLTQKNQIVIDKINYSIQDDNYFSAGISTASSFPSALSLISDLLQNRRLIEFDQFTLSVDKDTSNKKININLPLKIYYWPKNVQK